MPRRVLSHPDTMSGRGTGGAFWGKSLQSHLRGANLSRWSRSRAPEARNLGKIGSMKQMLLTLTALLLVPLAAFRAADVPNPANRPNIVIIYADDLGYGDVCCNGATKVKTPNIDSLAAQGLRFTDTHSSASTCTPSRYSLLTGEYAWRHQGTDILPGDAALIIAPGRATLPALLKQAGYTTGAIGKWHLGLGTGNIDWNKDIKPGPLEIGFDYAFIMPATGDRVPCVYIENHRIVGLDPADPIQVNYDHKVGDDPTGREHPEMLKTKFSHGHDGTIVNGISRIGFMSGGKAVRWNDEELADTLTRKAVAFIERSKDKPFFLYFATHDIHVPRCPGVRFKGKTELGVRGDVIEQLDWCAGEIIATLNRLKLTENTLVIFTSDNGPIVDDGYADGARQNLDGHKPAGPFRGGKYTAWEGGTRMPFIVRWPGRVKPGTSDALISQVDFCATFAKLAGVKPPVGAAPDSSDVLPALLGDSPTGRPVLVEQGMPLALRQGPWKFIGGPGKGKRAKRAREEGDENIGDIPLAPSAELYNLADDIAEEHNLVGKNPQKARELSALLDKIRQQKER